MSYQAVPFTLIQKLTSGDVSSLLSLTACPWLAFPSFSGLGSVWTSVSHLWHAVVLCLFSFVLAECHIRDTHWSGHCSVSLVVHFHSAVEKNLDVRREGVVHMRGQLRSTSERPDEMDHVRRGCLVECCGSRDGPRILRKLWSNLREKVTRRHRRMTTRICEESNAS